MSSQRYIPLVAGCMILAAGGAAQADCAEELAALQQGSGAEARADGEIAKDGSLAPLETEEGADAAVTTETSGDDAQGAEGEGVAKDGTEAPLEGEGTAAAASEQAAEAQQEGGAAGDQQADAIARAEAALAEGDEEACMQAVEEARSL